MMTAQAAPQRCRTGCSGRGRLGAVAERAPPPPPACWKALHAAGRHCARTEGTPGNTSVFGALSVNRLWATL